MTPPSPHLRQSPSPTPGEPTPNGEAIAADPPNVGQLLMVLLAQMNKMNANMDGIKANTSRMEKKMDGMTQTMRGETRQMGQCLQAGIMATPRAATSELKGSAPAGEDRVIRETCWARREKVTVTERKK